MREGSKQDVLHETFMNCFSEFGFTQVTREAAHERSNTLDLMFVNFNFGALEPSVIHPSLSDQYFTKFEVKGGLEKPVAEWRKLFI